MIYTDLGKTGLRVSRLGFGAMRLPMQGDGDNQTVNRELAIPMIHRAFEAGVNYIDTAIGYCREDSQRAVGDALKGWRDRIVVSTKNHFYDNDEKTWWTNLENSLERLGVEYIDIYNMHGMSWKGWEDSYNPHLREWMRKAGDQGLIKHACCSFHDDNAGLMKLADTADFEVITLQYNMLDRQLEEGIAYAASKGIGIVAMGPVAGGRLGVTTPELKSLLPGTERVPELALKFVLANPNVAVALSGMENLQMVEENAATASTESPLTDEEKAAIDAHLVRLKKMADLYCSGCEYCLPCPVEIRIPFIFSTYNDARVYGLWDLARQSYGRIGTNPWYGKGNAETCTECGACEEKCPQKLPIRKQLKEAHEALKEQSGG